MAQMRHVFKKQKVSKIAICKLINAHNKSAKLDVVFCAILNLMAMTQAKSICHVPISIQADLKRLN